MSRMLGRATLTIPASPSAAVIAEAVATSFAHEAGIPAEGVARLQRALRCLVSFSVEKSYGGDSGGDIEVSLELDTDGVVVDVHDWGKPFRRAGGPDGPLPAGLKDAEAVGENVRLINLANEGKRLTLHIATEHAIALAPVIDGAADAERASRSESAEGDLAVDVPRLWPWLRPRRLLPSRLG
jgi:anti-sigma regulatory factor (Ser/Thr protein kinase)